MRHYLIVDYLRPLIDYLDQPVTIRWLLKKPEDSKGLTKRLEDSDRPVASDLIADLDESSSVKNPVYMLSAFLEGMDTKTAKRFFGEQPKSK